MAISPNKQTLYYANYGLSPSSLYKFDVSGTTAVLQWENPFGTIGSNGQDLALSHDGSFISYACGAGQGGYNIAKFRTSDMAILGTFNTGAYPREITFSPDDQVAYSVNTSGEIKTWNTNTFLSMGTMPTVGEAYELMVDSSAQHLFAAFDGTLRIYDTGRVPEPGCALLLLAGGFVVLHRRARGHAWR